ncbi:MAG: HEAT repeat domain-containing protein [Clostridiales bacterium]|nr:HEAT repeat domain-containing protein [Clostridiales bacterium]
MGRLDSIGAKIDKLASKGKLDAVIKFAGDKDPDVRTLAAVGMGKINTYESGMALIPLLRDPYPQVRAAAATSAADIGAKHCEEYVKKIAFADPDADVRLAAQAAFYVLKDKLV